jgi:hypothetical protein
MGIAQHLAALGVFVSSVSLVSCGLMGSSEPTTTSRRKPPPPSLDGSLGAGPIARVPSGTFGPHLVMTEQGPFVAWAEPADDGASWQVRAPGTKDRLRLGPTLPKTLGTLAFFKLDRAKGGALVARVTRQDNIDKVSVTTLTPSGASAPHEVSTGQGEVLWAASAVEARGTRLLWARRHGAAAEVSAAVLDPVGLPGPSQMLRKESIGWQLGQGGAGTWLVTLEGSSRQAALMLTRLDTGAAEPRPIELGKDLSGADQVDLAVGAGGVVVTVRQGAMQGGRLLMAEVDARGTVTVPLRPISGPRGAQSLFELLPGAGTERPWLAWEEAAMDGPSWRRVLLARLRPDGAPVPEAWLDVRDGGSLLPALAVADGAIVALTRETPCAGGDCRGPASGLSLLALGRPAGQRLAISQLPGLPAGLDRASVCWDLDCLGGACALLCADSDTPTSVHFVAVERPAGGGAASAGGGDGALRELGGLPRLTRRERVAPVPELSDLAVGLGEGRTVLAWVSYFDPALRPAPSNRPAPDGRREPFQAEVRATCLERDGAADGPATPPRVVDDVTVSHRARSLGGVTLSSPRAGRRVLGWSALDQGRSHVFLTLLDERGKKLKQRLLNRKSGEVTDVQVAVTSGGYLALWVDDRSGRGQIYAQAVDSELNSVGPERAVTTDATAPVGLTLLQRKDEVVLAFADDADGRSGSIFLLSLDLTSLETTVPPRVVSRSDGHAHSPALFAGPGGDLGVMFIENRIVGDEEMTSTLRAVTIDLGLRAVGASTVVIPAVDVSSFAVDCTTRSCRLVAIAAGDRRAEVWAGALVGSGSWRTEFVQGLDGDAQRLPPPLLAGSEAYVVSGSDSDVGFALERLVIDFAEDALGK